MKRILFVFIVGLSSVFLLSGVAVAQNKPFIVLEYMHVKPQGGNAYIKTEDFWRHIHLAQQKKGNILGWSVWQVVAPYNMDAPYQYVVQTVYPHFSNFLHPYEGIDIKQVFPDTPEDSLQQMFSETGKTRDLIRQDIFSPDDHVGNVDVTSINYMMVNYLTVSPDKHQSFEAFMKDHRKPIVQKIVKGGFADFWWYGGLLFGNEANSHYNLITCYLWKGDKMFDSLPPFAEYKKEDPTSDEGYKWRTVDRTELLHKVVSLESAAK